MSEVAALLERADRLLEAVTVSGASAYALVDARKLLRRAYDQIKDASAEHEYKAGGSPQKE